MAGVMQADSVVPGTVQAVTMVATEPLSFWGGYDAATGEIIDRRHPLSGQCAAGRVLVLPGARGSSTGTAVLLESVRVGKAPAALVTDGRDAFFALAAIVARLMYGRSFAVVAMDAAQLATIPDGVQVRIAEDGRVSVGDETAG
jgi:predicted aconitase with swiveling domain